MDLEKIVGSLIPDEQKEVVKAEFEKELSNYIKEETTKLKKELSQKYDVNLFEEDVNKAYKNDNFIKKELYDEVSQKISSIEQEREQLNNELQKYKKENELTQVNLKLVTEGFDLQRLDVAKPFIEGEGTVEEKVERLKATLPELFRQNQFVEKKFVPEKEKKVEKSAAASYFEEQMKKNRI